MKFSKKILFAALVFSVSAFAQNVALNDTVYIIYGALNYEGRTIFVTERGLIPAGNGNYNSYRRSTNEEFSQYYKMIYGENAENPNYVIDGENISFVPFVNINELYGNNRQVLNGISVSDLAKTFSENNFPERNEILNRIKTYAEKTSVK